MSARCFDDTCTIVFGESSNMSGPSYTADVQLDGDATPSPTPTIQCGDFGLEAIVSGAAGNLLSKSAAGLMVTLPGIEYEDFGDVVTETAIAPDRTTDPAAYAVSVEEYAFTNGSGRDGMILLHGSYLLKYAVVGTGEAFPAAVANEMIRAGHIDSDADGSGSIVALTPFNAQWYASLLVGNAPGPANVDGNARAVRQFPTSGLTVTPATADDVQYQQVRTNFTFATPLAAGDTLYVKHRWAHQGKEQTVNVAAGGTGIYDGLGGHLSGQAIFIPMTALDDLD